MGNVDLICNGYGTAVYIDDTIVSCVSLSFNQTVQYIKSNGSYRGEFHDAIGSPFLIDYPQISCQMTIQPTWDHFKMIMDWIFSSTEIGNKQEKAHTIKIHASVNTSSMLFEDCCYLQSASIKVSQGSFLTMDLSFYINDVYYRDDQKFGGSGMGVLYQANKTGLGKYSFNRCINSFKDNSFIPYYWTDVRVQKYDKSGYFDGDVMGWGFNYSRNILKKSFCGQPSLNREIFSKEYSKTDDFFCNRAPLPQIYFGKINLTFDVEYLCRSNITQITDFMCLVNDENNKIQIKKDIDAQFYIHGKTRFELCGVTMTSFSPIISKDSTYGVNVSFQAHAIKKDFN